MRRLLAAIALLLAGFGAFAASAQATFHLNKVNEVMLSGSGGNAGVQFVEFFDNGGPTETFPAPEGPYKLVVYDSAGAKLNEQTLSGSGLSSARAAGRPYLVSTAAADSALAVTGDQALTVSLPLAGGQACYTAGSGEVAYSCITWGCIAKAIATSGTGSAAGAVPPAGQSAQRQPDDTIQIAAPTPKAANVAGTGAPACPGGGGSPGGGQPGSAEGGQPGQPGAGSSAFAGATLVQHKVKVGRNGRVTFALRCPAGAGACRVVLTLLGHSHRFRVAAGHTKRVSITLTQGARTRVTHKHRLRLRLRIATRDAAGQTSTATVTVVLLAARG